MQGDICEGDLARKPPGTDFESRCFSTVKPSGRDSVKEGFFSQENNLYIFPHSFARLAGFLPFIPTQRPFLQACMSAGGQGTVASQRALALLALSSISTTYPVLDYRRQPAEGQRH